jgi:hypothetical protein
LKESRSVCCHVAAAPTEQRCGCGSSVSPDVCAASVTTGCSKAALGAIMCGLSGPGVVHVKSIFVTARMILTMTNSNDSIFEPVVRMPVIPNDRWL